jgi:hypothetical protein
MKRAALLPLLLAFLASCSRKPEPESTAIPWASATATSAPTAALAPAPTEAAPAAATEKIVWTSPPSWQRLPSNSQMRKAWYRVPSAAGSDAAEVMVFYFGQHEGGGSEANIQRWIGQFPDAKPADVKRTERTANAMKQTVVEVEGTFTVGAMATAPSPPKPNYALVAAVVETPAGSYFFKMTGPKKAVEGARSGFFSLLDSVHPS